MSKKAEEKKQRSVDEIRQEYTQVCARLGHLSYTKHTVERDIATVNKALEDLNFEAAAASAKAALEAAEKSKAENGAVK